ncbi:TonB-dependent receptor domain-containing protein, partial [Caulobacter sp. HMWF009]
TLSAADTPDSLFTPRGLPGDLSGMSGSNGAGVIPTYFQINTKELIKLLDTRLGICNVAPGDTCLAPYSTDRRITEKSLTPWIQSLHAFEMPNGKDLNVRLGVRYEETKITSKALASIPTGTVWVAQNEISLVQAPGTGFSTLKGEYKNWLPAVDVDFSPIDNVKVRASYSQTITRPDYASMQGGITLGQPLRVGAGGSQASAGNPALEPYKSENIDLSAEWYYARTSYVSVGRFDKKVKNFIANGTTQTPLFDLNDPSQGAAAVAARAALGANASFDQIVNWVRVNRSADYVAGVGTAGGIIGRPADPDVAFTFTQPSNSDQEARLSGWEFAITHNFGDTGFGAILNYTIVDSDTSFDNTLPWTTTQFAITGASDSANAVAFYDKNGLQARVAYNWRDKFLAGKDQDPYYIKSYGQFDASASYEFRKGFTAFFEGINVLNEDRTGVRRNDRAIFFAAPGYSRYSFGVRYTY